MNWKLSHIGPALVLSSGHCWYEKRRPEGLYIEDMLEFIEKYPDRQSYQFVLPRIVKLGEAVEQNKLDELGTIQDHYSTVTIPGTRQKRYFEDVPLTGSDLVNYIYDSEPLKVEE